MASTSPFLIQRARTSGATLLALIGLRPVQPVEVLYFVPLNLAYLVISKVGCSAIKECLMSAAQGPVDLDFEAVHTHLITQKQDLHQSGLEHRTFTNRREFSKFLGRKHVLLIQRPIIPRAHSAYSGLSNLKNRMVFPTFPKYSLDPQLCPELSFHHFCRSVRDIPDHLADRHYRSQSFYWDSIPDSSDVIHVELRDIARRFAEDKVLKQLRAPRVRNVGTPVSDRLDDGLHELIRVRYQQDLRYGNPLA